MADLLVAAHADPALVGAVLHLGREAHVLVHIRAVHIDTGRRGDTLGTPRERLVLRHLAVPGSWGGRGCQFWARRCGGAGRPKAAPIR